MDTEKAAVYQLDHRERLAGFAAALVAAAAFAAIWVPLLHQRAAKGSLDPATSLIIGLVMGAALAAATAVGRRALVGFVALFIGLGGPWNHYVVAQVPFLALAGWLLVRASRVSGEARRAAREAKGAGAKGAGTDNGRRPPGRRGREATSARRAPKASKRYTPPKEPARKATERPKR